VTGVGRRRRGRIATVCLLKPRSQQLQQCPRRWVGGPGRLPAVRRVEQGWPTPTTPRWSWGRHPQGRPHGRGAQPHGCAAGQPLLAAIAAGYQQLLGWGQAFGRLRRAGVERTGSYAAALSRHLQAAGVQVLDVNQPGTATRRRRGKTDAIDAPGRRPCGACRSGDRDRQDRRWAGGDGPDVQACQGLGDQVPHPGDQPAQGRAGGGRPGAAGVAAWAEQPGCASADARS
jgi:hypothetical protein